MRSWLYLWFSLMPGFSLPAVAADELTPEQLEQWFEDDERDHPYALTGNDGELVFLPTPPAGRIPHSINILTIEPRSLQSGWVKIEQCHQQLDPIAKVEVVYRYKQMRNLRITSTSHIDKAWVAGQSIQLENVAEEALLCVQMEARILSTQSNGRWLLRNGPFQRRFLDSYYPMHVTLTINYPGEQLSLQEIIPEPTSGFNVKAERGLIQIDTWFEGKLVIELEFRLVT